MNQHEIDRLRAIKTFPSLVKYLRDELGWPIESDEIEELTYEYEPEELGLDPDAAVKIKEIKQLRPLTNEQPWGIFFVNFEPKRLPVVVLRRILSALVIKKRASAKKAQQAAWASHDLLFISSYGTADERSITFAHFTEEPEHGDLPALRVLAWDDQDTPLHIEHAHGTLKKQLSWPEDQTDLASWRTQWSAAFTMRHRLVVTTSKELAVRLAELARSIRKRANMVLAVESKRGPFKQLHAAFKEALVHDLTEDGFADMYAQTVAYGLLTARVSRPAGLVAEDLTEMVPVTNPFLKELLSTFLNIGGRKKKIDFDELGINDVVELLRAANMEAVLRDFGNRNPNEDPVIHFYELFLKEYDAKEKVKRGVFYTPLPVVSFIVRSVDELLKTEFGLEDGLADITTWGELKKRKPEIELPKHAKPETPFVQILDFATGTGTFMVQVIETINRTMTAKWKKAGYRELEIAKLWDEYVPRHLLPRLHGFELMMAPYAIAHMKIGLKLWETGYRFRTEERVRLYLTNTLEEPKDFSPQIEIFAPALAHEAKAANRVKSKIPVTVVVGNPPYSGHSVNNEIPWIVDKVYDYKRSYPDLNKPGQAKWLQDDYVKFLRFAQDRVDTSRCGTIGVITNNSYLSNPTFKGMRSAFSNSFSQLLFVNLHGSTKKRELAEDGSVDENVFEIQQGVAISLCVAAPVHKVLSHTYGDLYGSCSAKYQVLLARTASDLASLCLTPVPEFHLFVPVDDNAKGAYDISVSVPDIFNQNGDPAPGMVTTQDEFAVSFTKQEAKEKIELLLNTNSEQEARSHFRLCKQAQWDYSNAKRELANGDWRKKVVPLMYRPFDFRWTVYDRNVAVHRRERASRHMLKPNNIALITTRAVEIQGGFSHVFVSTLPIQHHTVSLKEVNYIFPLYLHPSDQEVHSGLYEEGDVRPNVDPLYCATLCCLLEIPSTTPNDVFAYVYAILHSNLYRAYFADFFRTDYPRIPYCKTMKLYTSLCTTGASLLKVHTMASYTDIPTDALNGDIGCSPFNGSPFRDISKGFPKYVNGAVLINENGAGFLMVSEGVWDFCIGGYQVCEKWLKDRRGRTLTDEDIEHYQKIVVAIKETIRLMGEIDNVIEEHGGFPGAFVTDPKIIDEAKAKAKTISPF